MFFGNEFETEVEADYLFGSKKRKKAAAAAAQAASKQLLESGQPLTAAERQTMLLSADGKLSARDKKIIKQAQRQDAKTQRVIEKQAGKTERTEARQEAKVNIAEAGATRPETGTTGLPVPLTPASGENTALGQMLSGGGGGGLDSSLQSWTPPEQEMIQESKATAQDQQQQQAQSKASNIGKIVAVVAVVILAVILFIKFRKK